jgi:hypothetical protein
VRRIIGGTVLALLAGGAIALAAGNFNTYKATETFTPNHAGSKSKPAAFSAIAENWSAGGTHGRPAAPLIKIVAKNYGMVTNGKQFPTCTSSKINANGNKPGNKGWNKICPKGSLIGQGPVSAEFVNPNPPYNVVGQCNPYLYIYNGGPKTQVFFFTEYPYAPSKSYRCLGGHVVTGAAPAYDGTVSYIGKTWVLTIPLPPTVSNNAGGTGLFASLVKLHVVYSHATLRKNGKTIHYGQSIACSSGKRPYSFAFTAQNFNEQSPHTQTVTVNGTQSCT